MSPEESPLALSFEDALSPKRFLSQFVQAGEMHLRTQLMESGNQAFGIALAAAKFVLDKGTVRVVFEKGIPRGAKLMKATGSALPVLVDGTTGKILKVGRVASKGRAVASIAANSALIVVEAAHMISGHDNAKRLKNVERSVDRLIRAHESELKSRLEAIYRYSKELLYPGAYSLSPEVQRELQRQCKELMELRGRLRDDFRQRINKIDPAKAGSSTKLLFWKRKKSLQKNQEAKIDESMQATDMVNLMHFSLMLQMALAGSAGTLEAFQRVTLPDECKDWNALAEFAKTRTHEIVGKEEKAEFTRFHESIEELAAFGPTAYPKIPPRGGSVGIFE